MTDVIKAIIVDDEQIAREILEVYLSKIPHIEWCGSFGNGIDAVAFTKTEQIDLVFLDIHMSELNGFSVIDILSNDIKVIFTTAHREYALKGFEVNALDYLLKPISFDRFYKSVQKYSNYKQGHESIQGKGLPKYLFIRSDRKMQKVNLVDILYIESYSDYVKIHTSKEQYLTRETITHIESKLPKHLFLRCHRSYIVALDKIQAYTNEHIELDQLTIPISRSYKNDVVSFLGRL